MKKNSNDQNGKNVLNIRISNFEFVSYFGFRASDLNNDIIIFTPIEKATDEVGGDYPGEDGGLKPPSSNTVRGRSSLTGFTVWRQ